MLAVLAGGIAGSAVALESRVEVRTYVYDSSHTSTTPYSRSRSDTDGVRSTARASAGVVRLVSGDWRAPKVGGGLPSLPSRLAGGPKNVNVYQGIDESGEAVYSGISNNLRRRAAQHGDRFTALDPVTTAPVTRGQARRSSKR